MTTMDFLLSARRLGLGICALTLLTASSCDGDTIVDAVPDWGGGERSPYVPEGFELTFEDNFTRGGASASVHLVSADAPSQDRQVEAGPPRAWETHFAGWGVRYLEGNNDQALKADAGYRGRGGSSLGEHGVVLHEITEDGTLKLYGRPTPTALRDQFEMPYLGGMVSGEKLHAQTYGYWEMRVRLNAVSAGHHWAFWLIPDDHSWPPEIDMLEAVGSNPSNQSDADYFFFNSILTDPNNDEITRITPPRGKNAWYTIGFLWTETDMRWFLDGQEVRRRPAMGDDVALYFLASPEVGGNWVGAPTAKTTWPTEAEIDYVRVYRRG
ncbi:MAG: family 16 glycosylhydrolase [Alphaproteobacteria bacterium]|nr:family 16 glycosylhydrolase [Alphaproteobacteria bacterium]